MRFRTLTAVGVLAAASLAAHADPLVYTLSGNFTGTLGGSSFTNVLGSFSETADSSAVTALIPNYQYENVGSVSLTLTGYTPVNFDTTFMSVESLQNTASFYDFDGGFGVSLYSDTIGTYDLTTALNPVTGFFVGAGVPGEYSSGGYVTITDAANLTFSATPAAPVNVAATPEPSSIALLGTGLLGMAGMVRRRFSRR